MNHASRLAFLLAALLCSLLPAADGQAQAQSIDADGAELSGPERILSFHSDVVVQPDSSIEVSETITFLVRGTEISRGIRREFPTRYRERSGRDMKVGFDVLSVKRNGAPEKYKVESANNGKSVKIGDADVILPHGVHTYEIRYTTNRQLGFFDSHDELYWNVTGNGWSFAIDKASAYISLPERVEEGQLRLSGYTGAFESKEQNLVSEQIGNRQAYFETTAPLGPYEGLTIVAEFPKGIIAEPSRREALGFILQDYRTALAGAVGLVIVLLYYFVAWLGAGVDPRGRRGELLTGPPEELSPAALGYIQAMATSYPLMSASIMSMGQKGVLRVMEDASGDYVLQRVQAEPTEPLTSEEGALLTALFKDSESIEIKQGNHSRISGAMTAFTQVLARQCDNVYFRRNTVLSCSGCAMSLALVGLMALIGGSFESLLGGWTIAVLVVLIGLNILFSQLMPAYTRRGRNVLDAIEGFRATLSGQGEYQATLREQFLPYAVALGVEKQWSQLFNQALATQSDVAYPYRPHWYYGNSRYDNGNYFDTSRFMSDFSSNFSSTISSSSSAPGSSSGGGGGGSSGGGGGGGGGSGW